MVFVGVGVAIAASLVVVFLATSGKKDTPAEPKPAVPAAAKPTPAAAPSASPAIALAGARAGKTPEEPAPGLTQDTLTKVRDLLQEAKKLSDEGVKARTAGDNQKARERQSAAKDKIEALQKMIEAPLRWQEKADLGSWAQPAEYVTLENLYGEVSKLEKRVRMGGGT
ncbi:MAG: hypothetical protein MUC36_13485 [Planctomycetes bacterium]|nr:hypothetical protein [Planctomycetota bacterium]